MKKYMYFIILFLIAVVLVFIVTMRYAAYKSPSTDQQGKATGIEKKLFNAIDSVLYKK